MKSLSALVLFTLTVPAFTADKGWSFANGDGWRDVLFDGVPVLRHMNASDPARREETFKPYTHVYDFAGKDFLTKGAGGNFTHHRGLFIGWNKTLFDGKSFDFWHCKNVIRRHVSYVQAEEKTGPDAATMVSVTEWPAPDQKIVVRETQRLTAAKPAEGKLVIDLNFSLEAPSGPVKLEGDLQHAGFHFRAAQEVHTRQKETAYILPDGAVKEKGDTYTKCDWVVCQFNIGDKRYAVAHFNDPKNPKPLQYSTRAYGRFGAFSKTEIPEGKPLNLRYRVIVTDTAKVPVGTVADWQKQWDAFAAEK